MAKHKWISNTCPAVRFIGVDVKSSTTKLIALAFTFLVYNNYLFEGSTYPWSDHCHWTIWRNYNCSISTEYLDDARMLSGYNKSPKGLKYYKMLRTILKIMNISIACGTFVSPTLCVFATSLQGFNNSFFPRENSEIDVISNQACAEA